MRTPQDQIADAERSIARLTARLETATDANRGIIEHQLRFWESRRDEYMASWPEASR